MRFHSKEKKRKGLPQIEMRLYGVLYLMKREAEFAPMTGRLDTAKSLSPRGKYHDQHELFFEQAGRRTTCRRAKRRNCGRHNLGKWRFRLCHQVRTDSRMRRSSAHQMRSSNGQP